MARKVFFSFHFERDVWRASVVRNSDQLSTQDERGFIDAAEWEKIKKGGDAGIERWIKGELEGTTVTVVLLGAETSTRPWVRFEIQQSYKRGNGLLGVRINNIKDSGQRADTKGSTDFGEIGTSSVGRAVRFENVAVVYDWINDDGYTNFSTWVDAAAKAAGK